MNQTKLKNKAMVIEICTPQHHLGVSFRCYTALSSFRFSCTTLDTMVALTHPLASAATSAALALAFSSTTPCLPIYVMAVPYPVAAHAVVPTVPVKFTSLSGVILMSLDHRNRHYRLQSPDVAKQSTQWKLFPPIREWRTSNKDGKLSSKSDRKDIIYL
jgi:hypothetical protein